MPARGAVTLFRIRGIRVGIDYSWFFVLFLIIFWLSSFYRSILNAPDNAIGPYALAVASALAFFASILLHELGHAFVALRRGIGISDITLWMFGGVARMTRDSDSPGTEFKIAIAGPVVTLLIAILCVAVGILSAGGHDFWEAMRVRDQAHTSGILALVAWLASDDAASCNGQVFRVGGRSVWPMKGWHSATRIKNPEPVAWDPKKLGAHIKEELAKGITAPEGMGDVFAGGL